MHLQQLIFILACLSANWLTITCTKRCLSFNDTFTKINPKGMTICRKKVNSSKPPFNSITEGSHTVSDVIELQKDGDKELRRRLDVYISTTENDEKHSSKIPSSEDIRVFKKALCGTSKKTSVYRFSDLFNDNDKTYLTSLTIKIFNISGRAIVKSIKKHVKTEDVHSDKNKGRKSKIQLVFLKVKKAKKPSSNTAHSNNEKLQTSSSDPTGSDVPMATQPTVQPSAQETTVNPFGTQKPSATQTQPSKNPMRTISPKEEPGKQMPTQMPVTQIKLNNSMKNSDNEVEEEGKSLRIKGTKIKSKKPFTDPSGDEKIDGGKPAQTKASKLRVKPGLGNSTREEETDVELSNVNKKKITLVNPTLASSAAIELPTRIVSTEKPDNFDSETTPASTIKLDSLFEAKTDLSETAIKPSKNPKTLHSTKPLLNFSGFKSRNTSKTSTKTKQLSETLLQENSVIQPQVQNLSDYFVQRPRRNIDESLMERSKTNANEGNNNPVKKSMFPEPPFKQNFGSYAFPPQFLGALPSYPGTLPSYPGASSYIYSNNISNKGWETGGTEKKKKKKKKKKKIRKQKAIFTSTPLKEGILGQKPSPKHKTSISGGRPSTVSGRLGKDGKNSKGFSMLSAASTKDMGKLRRKPKRKQYQTDSPTSENQSYTTRSPTLLMSTTASKFVGKSRKKQKQYQMDSPTSQKQYQMDSSTSQKEYTTDSPISQKEYQKDSSTSQKQNQMDSSISKKKYTTDLPTSKYQNYTTRSSTSPMSTAASKIGGNLPGNDKTDSPDNGKEGLPENGINENLPKDLDENSPGNDKTDSPDNGKEGLPGNDTKENLPKDLDENSPGNDKTDSPDNGKEGLPGNGTKENLPNLDENSPGNDKMDFPDNGKEGLPGNYTDGNSPENVDRNREELETDDENTSDDGLADGKKHQKNPKKNRGSKENTENEEELFDEEERQPEYPLSGSQPTGHVTSPLTTRPGIIGGNIDGGHAENAKANEANTDQSEDEKTSADGENTENATNDENTDVKSKDEKSSANPKPDSQINLDIDPYGSTTTNNSDTELHSQDASSSDNDSKERKAEKIENTKNSIRSLPNDLVDLFYTLYYLTEQDKSSFDNILGPCSWNH